MHSPSMTIAARLFACHACRRPWVRRLGRLALWLTGIGYLICGLVYLALRFLVLPHIADYRPDLERALGSALGRPVAIGQLGGDWEGLRPRLSLGALRLMDDAGQPALVLEQVEAVAGWTSLLYLQPRFHRIALTAPTLDLRRDRAGRVFVAGLPVNPDSTDMGLGDWLLAQERIVIRDARVAWRDESRQAPPLTLSRLNLDLHNDGARHRFGLTAEPPSGLASPLDVRGDLKGRHLGANERWTGQVYADMAQADLAGWKPWVDYPVELPQGRGALRLWLDIEDTRPVGLTADLALTDLRVRLAADLPMLDLTQFQGRLRGRQWADGFEIGSEALSLRTAQGLSLPATDLHLSWRAREGVFSVNALDLENLGRLAAYLPLPETLRKPLLAYGPKGRFQDVRLDWNGRREAFEHFRVKGRFSDVSVAAQGAMPGLRGIAGQVEGSESGGSFELSSQDGAVELPAIFVESVIPLHRLEAKGGWKRVAKGTEIALSRVALANRDAEGVVSGRYRHVPGSLGEIDLDGAFTRAEAPAVWRYLPRVVSADVTQWLRGALRQGRSARASLKLKGPLDQFPFAHGEGIFRIQAEVQGGSLKYAEDWPQIDDIAGQLLFDGPRMSIEARQGRTLGATLGPVKAEIADLGAHEPLLTITGRAVGPTTEFLKFIEASPVGAMIDHGTADMTASGSGELDLTLNLPLARLDTSRVNGSYRFDGNRYQPDPAAPMLEDVRGRLFFSEHGIEMKDGRARILGGPAQVEIQTDREGRISVEARGEVGASHLRQQYGNLPLLDYLSGAARWNGSVRIRKKAVEIRVASDLKGLASSLPEPFNKSAAEVRPLLFERKALESRPGELRRGRTAPPVTRDQLSLSLGKSLRSQWQRRNENGDSVVERGFIALGDPPARPPERGVLLSVNLPRVDLDFWRGMAVGLPMAAGEGDLGPTSLEGRLDELIVFGRTVHEPRLSASRHGDRWSGEMKSREIAGRFDWQGGGAGRLSARLAQFSLPAAAPGAPPIDDGGLQTLPDLDLVFERFLFHERNLGELKLNADNQGKEWLTSVSLQNEDGSLTGQGRWRPGKEAGAGTRIDFKLKARSIEKLLNRIGYPDVVKRGTAGVEGNLAWNGPPYAIDYPSLSGSLKVEARDGQFNQLEPGAGRLLGVLSLQSLPRRITLDFRDIFSEGFAFDAIDGQASVSRGVMETRDLEIRGPAARVAMQGSVDLVRETQALRVRIQPALGETLTTASVLLSANPATGAAYWLANKLFGGPLDKVFAYEYTISGAWADPRVEKVGDPKPKEKP